MSERLYTGGLLNDQHPVERIRPPGIVHPAHQPELQDTAAHRRENRQTAALVVLICAAAFALIAVAAWIGTS